MPTEWARSRWQNQGLGSTQPDIDVTGFNIGDIVIAHGDPRYLWEVIETGYDKYHKYKVQQLEVGVTMACTPDSLRLADPQDIARWKLKHDVSSNCSHTFSSVGR